MYGASCSAQRTINWFQNVQQNRKQVIRAYCSNIYTVKWIKMYRKWIKPERKTGRQRYFTHYTYYIIHTFIRYITQKAFYVCSKCLPYYSIYANGILKQLPRFICMHKHIQLKIYQKTTSRGEI